MMKRLILTLLVSVAGFAATVSFGNLDVRSDDASVDRAESYRIAGRLASCSGELR